MEMAILHTISSTAPLWPVLASRGAYHGAISSSVLNFKNRMRSFPVLQISTQNSNLLSMEAIVDEKSAGVVHHVQDADEKPTDDYSVRRLIDSVFNIAPMESVLDDKPTGDGDDDPKFLFLAPDEIPFKLSYDISDWRMRLVREYQGESIQVNADAITDHVYMEVEISKRNQYNLYFSTEICDDGSFEIDKFEMRGGEALKLFEKYLEIREVKPSTTNILLNCIERKLKS